MILVIDNYDSFTFNLVQYLGEMGQELKVFRNDAITLDDNCRPGAEAHRHFPRPGPSGKFGHHHPGHQGVFRESADPRCVSGPSGDWGRFRRRCRVCAGRSCTENQRDLPRRQDHFQRIAQPVPCDPLSLAGRVAEDTFPSVLKYPPEPPMASSWDCAIAK